EAGRYTIVLDGATLTVDARRGGEGIWSILLDGASHVAEVTDQDGTCAVDVGGERYAIRVEEESRYIIRTRGAGGAEPGQGDGHPGLGGAVGGCRRRAHRAGGHEDGERVQGAGGGHGEGDPGGGR